MRLFDAHCHLDFMSNMEEVARDAAADGLHVLATTVTPQGYLRTRDALAGLPNVSVAVGAHPWWVADGRLSTADVEAAADLAGTTRLVGEVGMDFSPKHVPEGSKDVQRAAFRRICAAAAAGSDPARPTVMSIHSVRSAAEVLDVLRTTGCLERCRCVFHWFSGSSDELHAAVVAGCWFSVNPMMLRTRRGREYARQVPLRRLLTETDLPPGEDVPFSAAQIEAALQECLAGIAEARGCDAEGLAQAVCDNAERLLA
ncbi:TatD family hydrolase [Parafannyhessea umbonata]|jgi:TatD DNase family protein|uniref:TatD DNase family protein n=1 Tax=Parafannyhessea umbonata TaxID=604330 RepID=A0A1G6KI86_9ACTN|nr:TatD family hydrolase [Parafannyhessea umbonata]SDC30275.1 TatD DNase family protein [Parafannyhessea umbonata]